MRDWTLTNVIVCINTGGDWTSAESCTVDIDIAGSTIISFEVGDPVLDEEGNCADKDTAAVTAGITGSTTISQGDAILARHEAPNLGIGDECNTPTCICAASNAGHDVWVYGTQR